MKASRAGTEGYICKRSILADSQHTLTQRCFAGDMCAFSNGGEAPAKETAQRQLLITLRSRTITPRFGRLWLASGKSRNGLYLSV